MAETAVHRDGLNQALSRCTHRDAADDFFCLRYGVWYPSLDCAIRTRFHTSPGCRRCEQGRFNLKRHLQVVVRTRFPYRDHG